MGNRLNNGRDDLFNNDWLSVNLGKQKEICVIHDSIWQPVHGKLNVGVSTDLSSIPLNGLRHPAEVGTTGWFIWSGEFSDDKNFFKPLCVEHLLQIRPEIVIYLGLDVGFRFQINSSGYQDVWYDESLLNI